MKNSFLVILIIGLAYNQLNAQNSIDVKVGVHVERGYRNAASLAPPTNYTFGFTYDYYIKSDLFLKSGFVYNEHSRNLNDETFSWGSLERIVTRGNFEIPMCLGIKKEIDPFNLYLIGGPYYAYHLKGDIYSQINDAVKLTEIYETIQWGTQGDKWRVWEMGVYGEIGLEYKNIMLSCSYQRGLTQQFSNKSATLKSTKINDTKTTQKDLTYGVLPFSAKVFSVNATYIIPLGGSKTKM